MKFTEQIEWIVGLIDSKKSLPEIKEAVLALHEHAEAYDDDLQDALGTREQALADKDRIYEKYSELQQAHAALKKSEQEVSPNEVDGDTEKIIDLFFDEPAKWSHEAVAVRFQMQESVARFHFDLLRKRRFILPEPSRMVPSQVKTPPQTFRIGPDGTAYVMKKRKDHAVTYKMKWGCVIFDSDETLYCPACYFDGGKKVPTSRKGINFRFCAVCKTDLPSQ